MNIYIYKPEVMRFCEKMLTVHIYTIKRSYMRNLVKVGHTSPYRSCTKKITNCVDQSDLGIQNNG